MTIVMDSLATTAIAAVATALVAVGTLIYAIRSWRKQAQQLASQTQNISNQTDLLRKQIFGEIYDNAQIRDVCFFLPEKRKCVATGFEEHQRENEEITIGKECKIQKGKKTDIHAKWLMDAPQRLRYIVWGFLDSLEGKDYKEHPTIEDYKRPFVVKEISYFDREVTQDWSGFWHIEYPFPRFLPNGECFVLCFTVMGSSAGKFPLHFEVSTEEAKNSFKEVLWVDVAS